MRPIFIFDLDGTISLPHRREHFVSNREKKNWDAFNWASIHDLPNEPVIQVASALRQGGADILVWTGREAIVREGTEAWLDHHGFPARDLQMRPVLDRTEDHALKRSWYFNLSQRHRARIAGVFEDRARVVRMWRDLCVPCFQVDHGDF